jgi:hypothetical protein
MQDGVYLQAKASVLSSSSPCKDIYARVTACSGGYEAEVLEMGTRDIKTNKSSKSVPGPVSIVLHRMFKTLQDGVEACEEAIRATTT